MKFLYTIVTLLIFTYVKADNIDSFTNVTLSRKATISLITCGSGDELYSLFGHSAIRIKDESNNIDLAFNYGTFDFDTPNFFTKFAKGQLDYFLSTYPFHYFPASYILENRWVCEQDLNISNEEVNAVFHALILNAQDRNKYYRYDFFFDNCATRIRDILNISISGIIYTNDTIFVNRTIRDEMNRYLLKSSWTHLGLNLALGRFCDMPVNNWNSMYLPDNLALQLSKAFIKHNSDSTTKLLLTSPPTFLVKPQDVCENDILITPITLIISLLILFFTVMFYLKNSRLLFVIDSFFWLTLGLVGSLIFFLSIISSHSICRQNFNLLWISPIYLFYLFPAKRRIGQIIHKYLTYFILPLLLIFIISALTRIQAFPYESYILVLLIAFRILFKLPNFSCYINKKES